MSGVWVHTGHAILEAYPPTAEAAKVAKILEGVPRMLVVQRSITSVSPVISLGDAEVVE